MVPTTPPVTTGMRAITTTTITTTRTTAPTTVRTTVSRPAVALPLATATSLEPAVARAPCVKGL
jgi:hypothetical protein